jgi:hypothetical protein
MTIEHANIPNANLHEPKGASTASSGQVYVADGAGSGSFTDPEDLSIVGLGYSVLNVRIDDISTAGSEWVVSPWAGDITAIYSVIDGAIGTGDCTLSFEIGGVAVSSGNITITQSGSAAGDVDSSTPSSANTLTQGQAIECITDGASTNTVSANLTIVVDHNA